MSNASQNWAEFHVDRLTDSYPKWPNEVMVRMVFGDYLAERPQLSADSKVLDVGCGFAQNLLPFVTMGCDCHGVEITKEVAEVSREVVKNRGIGVSIDVGTNQSLPFEDETFDLLMSIDTIHYERSEEGMKAGLAEFARVLKPGGYLIMTTVGPEHDMQLRGERLAPHSWKIQNYDFRDGEVMYFFEQEETLQNHLAPLFSSVETGRVTQKLMKQSLDWFVTGSRK